VLFSSRQAGDDVVKGGVHGSIMPEVRLALALGARGDRSVSYDVERFLERLKQRRKKSLPPRP
jgi:hypothetical protein